MKERTKPGYIFFLKMIYVWFSKGHLTKSCNKKNAKAKIIFSCKNWRVKVEHVTKGKDKLLKLKVQTNGGASKSSR